MVDNSWPSRVVSSGRIEEKRDRKNPAWLRAEQDLSSHILAGVWSCFSQRTCVGFLEVFFWLFTECSLHLDRCLSVPGVGRSLSTTPRDLAFPSTPGASERWMQENPTLLPSSAMHTCFQLCPSTLQPWTSLSQSTIQEDTDLSFHTSNAAYTCHSFLSSLMATPSLNLRPK